MGEILFVDRAYTADKRFTLLFSVMWKAEKVSDIYKDMATGEYLVLNYTDDLVKLAFAGGSVTEDRIYDYFESRCIDRARPDMKERLQEIGLNTFNPYKIAKVIHGVLWDDYQWIKFPGDSIGWEDVKLRD